jgi:hypothetical protein
MNEKISGIKAPKISTMTDYKSAAQASHGEKLKAMGFAGGGNVNSAPVTVSPGSLPSSPIWKSVASGSSGHLPVSPPISKASSPLVPVRSFADGGTVIRGLAAEREMARMEKEARAEKEAKLAGHKQPRKG